MSTMTTKRPRESSPEASDTHKKPALEASDKPAPEASDKPAPTTGCECGCVLQEGRCGIKLEIKPTDINLHRIRLFTL